MKTLLIILLIIGLGGITGWYFYSKYTAKTLPTIIVEDASDCFLTYRQKLSCETAFLHDLPQYKNNYVNCVTHFYGSDDKIKNKCDCVVYSKTKIIKKIDGKYIKEDAENLPDGELLYSLSFIPTDVFFDIEKSCGN